jgi:hypothetical protein
MKTSSAGTTTERGLPKIARWMRADGKSSELLDDRLSRVERLALAS